jgi:nucleotide-binding universal stress UspA family protein
MKEGRSGQGKGKSKGPTALVAVDFSHCSTLALRRAKAWATMNDGKILALHVIDQNFVRHCIQQHLGAEEEIKMKLFINSKNKLRDFLRREEMDENKTQMVVCEGTPCMEINRKAVENDVEMIIMGSKGNSDDMRAIFFGSTTERVLRFIKRPVLCIPPESSYDLKWNQLEWSSLLKRKEECDEGWKITNPWGLINMLGDRAIIAILKAHHIGNVNQGEGADEVWK